MTAYASAAAHACVAARPGLCRPRRQRPAAHCGRSRAAHHLQALRQAIAADRRAGKRPFLLIGTAGSVDIGAIDDLAGLGALAAAERLWFHVDGAFGALGILAPEIAPRLAGIECADSLALDFNKWGQVPYDAGFVLIRQRPSSPPNLRRVRRLPAARGARVRRRRFLADDYGPDLSRGFRALKTWFTPAKSTVRGRSGAIEKSCAVARHLAACIAAEPRLELLAPVPLNIVCFRYRGEDSDALNTAIAADVQESGIAAPSTTASAARSPFAPRSSITVAANAMPTRCSARCCASAMIAPRATRDGKKLHLRLHRAPWAVPDRHDLRGDAVIGGLPELAATGSSGVPGARAAS